MNGPREQSVRERTARLDTSEARLAYLIANNPAVIYTCWPEGDFGATYISPNVTTLLGYAPEEFTGDPGFWARNVHPEDAAGTLAALHKLLEQGRQVHEYRFRAKDGTWRWMSDELTLVRGADGEPAEVVGVWLDVTRRKETEIQLRDLNATLEQRIARRTSALAASEQHLLRAQRLAQVGHWVWNGPPGEVFTGGKVEYSETATAIFGVPAEALALPDADYIERFVHPADRERIRAAFADHRERRRQKAPLEYRIVRPDGSVRSIVEITEVVAGDQDRPTEVMGTIHDITDRKSIETALRDSEARLRGFMDNAPVEMVVKDFSGRFLMASRGVAESWGLTEAEILGRHSRDLAPEIESAQVEAMDRAVVETGRPVARELYLPDWGKAGLGHEWTYEIKFPIEDSEGRLAAIGGIALDITEKKRAENALREGEARLRRAQLQARLASWSWNLESDRWSWAPGSGPALGLADMDLPTNDAGHNDFVHPADREMLRALDAEVRAGRDTYTAEFRCLRPSGEIFWVEEIGEIERDDAGRRVTLSGTLQDITERKRAEQRLRDSETRLLRAQRMAHVGHWVWTRSPAGDWSTADLHYSEAAAAIFGVPPEALAIRDADYLVQFVHPDDREHVAATFGDFRQWRRSKAPLEYRILRPDGTVRVIAEISEVTVGAPDRPIEVMGTLHDITDRKQAEAERQRAMEQLRLSEERFSKLFYASPFSVIVASYPDGRIVNVNEAFLRLFDFERQEVIGRTTSEINLWVDQQDRLAFVERIKRGEPVRDMELAFQTKSGDRRTLLMSVELVELDGKAHSLAMSIDITERKRIELAMQAISSDLIALEGPAYFAAAVRCMASLLGADIAFVTRVDPARPGELRTAAVVEDGAVVPNFSYPVAGTPSAAILEGRAHVMAAGVQRQYPSDTLLAEKGVEAYGGEPLFDHDGRPLGHLGVMSRRPFRDPATVGTILKMFGVATAAAMMREQVHRREAWLRAILENTPTQIVLKDLDLRMMAVSRNVAEERASSMSATIGKMTRDFFPPEIAEVYEAADRKVIATGEAVQQEIKELENGQVHYYHNVKFPLRDGGGGIIGVGSFSTDMTERRRLEEHLRHATKMEAIGKLTGGMAHDFNNYLAVIIGNLDLLKERVTAEPAAAQLIDVALGGALRGAELTQSLLAFSRAQPLDPRLVDVNRHLAAVAKLLKRTLGEDIALTTALAPDLWTVRVDGAQLDSGIVNLANNARDAMPRGGALSIATRNVQLDDSYTRMNADVTPGDYVLIEVSDNGAGMPPEILARVFEPFFSTKTPGHGTGLGLSMLYGFVKQSGGHIKIYSEVGHGTAVRLYLPRADAASADRNSAAPARPSLPRGTEAILVVEDNGEVRQTAVAQLASLGYRVIEAEHGEAALQILDRREPHLDLLFTDIVMPGKPDGYELAKLALERRPGIKVLLTSGFPGDTLRHNGKHTPHFGLLGKPYRREELARAIRTALESEARPAGDPE